MSDGIFIFDEAFIGCRFEHYLKSDSSGNDVDIGPIPIGILVGYERVYGADNTSFFFYREATGSIGRRRFKTLHHFRVVEEDRHLLVERLRYNLKFPKKKIREVPREELIDLD